MLVFISMPTQIKKRRHEYILQDQIATSAVRRESRTVAGSKRYSHISLFLCNSTAIAHPVTAWSAKQRVLLNNTKVASFS